MSVKGLEQSEKLAAKLNNSIKSSLRKQLVELKQELAKLEYLLGDPAVATAWANSQADASRIATLEASLSEVEKLYLQAGDTPAAKIFKKRTETQLKQKLTNLKANELEVELRLRKSQLETSQQLSSGLTEIRREGALRELYTESRDAGGFLSGSFSSSFGKAFSEDVVTMETKAAGSKTLGEYMSKMYYQYEDKIKDVFIRGIVRGDSYKQMTDALVDATKLTARKADLIVTTEANAIFNDSVRKTITTNPLVKGYRFRAVLDSHTSDICQAHDGQFISKDDIQPGVNYPPLHPRCRSTVTTVLYSEDERKDTMQRYTKNASNQWEKVPPGMNYTEFKDKFGFSNSNDPRTYNAAQRDLHDMTLAKVTSPTYRGYVKPSVSGTSRIQKLIQAYATGDTNYIDAVKENTGIDTVLKALFRQAQAESGFDGLPLKLSASDFDKQVEKEGLRKVYRQFGKQEHLDSFLTGDQMYGTGMANYGAGTYTFKQLPEQNLYATHTVEMALKTKDSKILDLTGSLDSQIAISNATTPDERINEILRKVAPDKRRDILSLAATEYGYDAVDVSSQVHGDYTLILNRTAVIVKTPEAIPVSEPVTTQYFSSTVQRESYISQTDPRIVKVGATRIVPNVPASAAMLDHEMSANISREAQAIYTRAVSSEPDVTSVMLKIADNNSARLDGVEFSVKTASSTEDKILRKIKQAEELGKTVSQEKIVQDMGDLLRYTIVADHDSIPTATLDAMKQLEANGMQIIELDNKYLQPNAVYKGVHISAEYKGQVFEVQVHSKESLDIKGINHGLYEKARAVSTSEDEANRLVEIMKKNTAKLAQPKGIENLKSFRRTK